LRKSYDTFQGVFDTVASGEADFGMAAVENSIYGPIGKVHDLLADADISVIGEVTLGIHHGLIGLREAKLDDITDVHSHPVALAQCKEFIATVLHGAREHEEFDTAGSVGVIKDMGEISAAAIASPDVADQHDGLIVLRTNIEDNSENYTRFLALQRGSGVRIEGADKTSLLIEDLGDSSRDRVTRLHGALGCFVVQGVDLVQLTPQPLQGRPWQPRYFVDASAGTSEPRMATALEELQNTGAQFRVLGSYKRGMTI
jgi:prephenate dehydratase